MNGDMYLTYLKLFPTKRPTLVLWSHWLLWIIALGVNLYSVTGNEPSLFGWVISFLIIVWCIFGVLHWGKLLWSKRAIERELKYGKIRIVAIGGLEKEKI